MVHRPAETQLNFHTETIAVRNAEGFGLLESSGDDCIGAVTLSVDNFLVLANASSSSVTTLVVTELAVFASNANLQV